MISPLTKLWTLCRREIRRVEVQSRHAQAARPEDAIDWTTMGVLTLAALILAILEYYGSSTHWKSLEIFLTPFSDDPAAALSAVFTNREYGRLARLTYWSATTFIGYFVVPALFVKLIMRRNLSDFGMKLSGAMKHWKIYVGLYLVVLPFVIAVAFHPSFQRTYPFYQAADRSLLDFFAWQLVYAAQFFALEFFYRGFLIHGLKNRLGIYALFVSAIPYCMIHFGKPLPETVGAILAGVALGGLSLYTRSIWMGVAIHVSVAMTMDITSLAIQNRLPF
ncbi:CPBP family intramembrane metalloprotease [Lujinxingia litoralis]|uniref:CPBP family intramembrane metalloprotease n=1 Tax=Lujinxingia litoralis TaxID=2211119 RepID=A0A328C7Q0_9DELT|nr:type II CAAX endopeptidase family protein [Lujinxingia litoralis]RAL21658.1 CPBP family intramembrane metalloprotease [Lujinxingia litoralis]